MSWAALAWATDSDIAHPVAKFILVLLANKADENFSCYPSIRTLMVESGARRSTVLRALSYLETHSFHSPASAVPRLRRAPLNPVLPESPSSSASSTRSRSGTPPSHSRNPWSRCGTGPVPQWDRDGVTVGPPGGPTTGPLESINRISIRTERCRGTRLGDRDPSVEAGNPRVAQSPTGRQVRPGARLAG